jgi:hypothetical protein
MTIISDTLMMPLTAASLATTSHIFKMFKSLPTPPKKKALPIRTVVPLAPLTSSLATPHVQCLRPEAVLIARSLDIEHA